MAEQRSDVDWWKVVDCVGGWNVWGMNQRDELVYECLHLHESRSAGVACGQRTFPDTKGPSR